MKRLGGMGVRGSATQAGYSITRVPPQMDGSFGADMMRFITGIMGLVRTWKMMPLRSPGWQNTSFRHSRNWQGCTSPMPGAGRLTPAHVSVHSGGRNIMERQPTQWGTQVWASALLALA